MTPVPVVTVCTLDPTLRDSSTGMLVCELPDALVVRHDLHSDDGYLHRVVFDQDGVLEDTWLPLAHVCLSCALREDVVPTVLRLARDRRPETIVLALPAATEPLPVVRAFDGVGDVRLVRLVTVVDGNDLEWDLFGDDLLAERGLEQHPEDQRSVGEALAPQLEHSDVVLSSTALSPRARAVIDHVAGPGTVREQLQDVRGAWLMDSTGTKALGTGGGPLDAAATGAPPAHGVWTLDLQSWRPFHPGRLLANIERLGIGPLRARGRFWVPTRPGRLCAWDGAGGQLSLGDVGRWTQLPDTRIVITGTDRDPADLITAFDATLLTDAELASGLDCWRGRPDGLNAWLGEHPEAA